MSIDDNKIKDAAIGGHYKNNSGENFFICYYGSGFSIFKADGEYLDGSKHLSLDGVKQSILYYNLTKVKDSVVDSKVEDSLSKKEKELCDYMLENALDDGEDENDLLKKMKVY